MLLLSKIMKLWPLCQSIRFNVSTANLNRIPWSILGLVGLLRSRNWIAIWDVWSVGLVVVLLIANWGAAIDWLVMEILVEVLLLFLAVGEEHVGLLNWFWWVLSVQVFVVWTMNLCRETTVISKCCCLPKLARVSLYMSSRVLPRRSSHAFDRELILLFRVGNGIMKSPFILLIKPISLTH